MYIPPDKRQGLRRLCLAGLLVLCGLGVMFVVNPLLSRPNSFQFFLIWLLGIALITWGATVFDHARRYFTKPGDQALASDHRPHVWYLRSFSDEQEFEGEERALVNILEEIGPLIAIGRPGEPLPPLGFARIYYPDESWQDEILGHLSNNTRAVVMRPGSSPGLGWEIRTCRTVLRPEQLIILVPKIREDYEQFKLLAREQGGITLPPWDFEGKKNLAFLKFVGLITFGNDWSPRVVKFSRMPLDYYGDARLRSAFQFVGAPLGIKLKASRVDRFNFALILLFSLCFILAWGFLFFIGIGGGETIGFLGLLGLAYLFWVLRSRRIALATQPK